MTKKQEIRRRSALSRLQTQLSSGVKIAKNSSTLIELSESDKARINREINSLKNKLA
jgi:flagellin-like hook-associated protein FlgL